MLVDRNAADAAAAAAAVVLAASTTMASEANLSSCWLSHFPFVTYVVAVFAAVFVFSYYLDDDEAGIEASLDLLVNQINLEHLEGSDKTQIDISLVQECFT